jgi:Leucine-rich repeat (LRR) protein
MKCVISRRGCLETMELGRNVRVTSTTTLGRIREAIADKLCVAAAAVAVFADSVEVTDYEDEIGDGFARGGLAYELRVSEANVQQWYADFASAGAGVAFMTCRKCTRRLEAMEHHLTLNCGCLLCLACAEQPVDAVLADGDDDVRSMTVCPYHLAPTPHDVQFADVDMMTPADDASWTQAPCAGPHEELAKLLRSQQCRFHKVQPDGARVLCTNTGLHLCRCGLPPMCSSCLAAHIERNAAAEPDIHGQATSSALAPGQLVARCSDPTHNSRIADRFDRTHSRLVCRQCDAYVSSVVECISSEAFYTERSCDAVAQCFAKLGATIRQCDRMKAFALQQYRAVNKNWSDGLLALDKDRDSAVSAATQGYNSCIEQMQGIIKQLERDRDAVVNGINDSAGVQCEEFVQQSHRQRANIVERVTAAQSAGRAAREHLAALSQVVHAAPGIVPAANALIDLDRVFDAPEIGSVASPLTLPRFPLLNDLCAPLVQFNVSSDDSGATVVSYDSNAAVVVRRLQIASNPIAPLPPCSVCSSTVAYRVVLAGTAAATTTTTQCLACIGDGHRLATLSQFSALGAPPPPDAYILLDEAAALSGLCASVCTVACSSELQATTHSGLIQHLIVLPPPCRDSNSTSSRASSVALPDTLLSLAVTRDTVRPNTAALPLLERLHLSDSCITDADIASLSSIATLQQMIFTGCPNISGVSVGNAASLTYLAFQRCGVTDVGLRSVAALQLLQHLDLCGSRNITDVGLRSVGTMQQLQHLDLSGCSGFTDVGLRSVAALQLLQHLDLSGCSSITDVGLRSVGTLKQVRHLDLSGCSSITDVGLRSVGTMQQLRHLDLSWCSRVTDVCLRSVSTLQELQHLILKGCSITDVGLRSVAALVRKQGDFRDPEGGL